MLVSFCVCYEFGEILCDGFGADVFEIVLDQFGVGL